MLMITFLDQPPIIDGPSIHQWHYRSCWDDLDVDDNLSRSAAHQWHNHSWGDNKNYIDDDIYVYTKLIIVWVIFHLDWYILAMWCWGKKITEGVQGNIHQICKSGIQPQFWCPGSAFSEVERQHDYTLRRNQSWFSSALYPAEYARGLLWLGWGWERCSSGPCPPPHASLWQWLLRLLLTCHCVSCKVSLDDWQFRWLQRLLQFVYTWGRSS